MSPRPPPCWGCGKKFRTFKEANLHRYPEYACKELLDYWKKNNWVV